MQSAFSAAGGYIHTYLHAMLYGALFWVPTDVAYVALLCCVHT